MLDSSSSSMWDASSEIKEKANEAILSTWQDLERDEAKQKEQYQQIQVSQTLASSKQTTSPNTNSVFTIPEPDAEELQQRRQKWAKTQINEINDQAKNELESLDALRTQQQEIYQEQLAEKNELWERVVLQRREEAAELRSMISRLTTAIANARNESKTEIQQAKRKAAESLKTVRIQREKQLKAISDLTNTLNKEKIQFENELKSIQNSDVNIVQQKKEQIERLQTNLSNLRAKLAQKEQESENKFKSQVRVIRDLRLQLQQAREAEADKQNELMSLRKACASISRKISARKDEVASLKRQLAMLQKDNEELQIEVDKMESNIFPTVFNSSMSNI